jgi:hypothetical protein
VVKAADGITVQGNQAGPAAAAATVMLTVAVALLIQGRELLVKGSPVDQDADLMNKAKTATGVAVVAAPAAKVEILLIMLHNLIKKYMAAQGWQLMY